MGYYRTRAEIHMRNLRFNVQSMKKRLGDGTPIMAIVKADAYGHGAISLADVLLEEGVAALGVATVEEGVELRQAGYPVPIVVLGYTNESEDAKLLAYDITPAIFQYERAAALSDHAVRAGKKAAIHIKVDTSMNRIGLKPTWESVETVKRIAALPGIEIEGLFSHFARADEADKTAARQALEKYRWFVSALEEENIHIPVKHISNSAASMEFDDTHFDMVRMGIVTYGLYPSEEVRKANLPLKPLLEWKSHLVQVKEVPEGEEVSYGGTFVTRRRTRIGTVPVGYADGYARQLSNKARVLVNGQYAPVIGRICMDQFMVDLTDLSHAEEGDEVTLIGYDGGGHISVEELSELSGRFPYEFVCQISKRVPRIYVE